jgi:hypothetical protein
MSVCRESEFPLCYVSTPSDILYIGDLDVYCGNCGCTFIAKTSLCCTPSPFMTETEVNMAHYLQDLARQNSTSNKRMSHFTVRGKMMKRFGEANYFKYKKTIMRDLAIMTTNIGTSGAGAAGADKVKGSYIPHFDVSTGDVVKRLGVHHEDDDDGYDGGGVVSTGTALETALALAQELKFGRLGITRGGGDGDGDEEEGGAGQTGGAAAAGGRAVVGTAAATAAAPPPTSAPASPSDRPANDSSKRTSSRRHTLRDLDGKICYATPADLVDLICDPNGQHQYARIEQAVRLTYPQFCTSSDLAFLMVEKLDHLMAVEDYNRQSLLVSVLNLFLDQLARYRRSNDSLDALAILECYVECSLEENAEHAHSPRDIQRLVKLSNSLKIIRNRGMEDPPNDYSALSSPLVLGCMQAYPPIDWPEKLRRARESLFHRATPQEIAMQLTLMGAAVYKRIQPRELVPSTRKDSANLQHLIMLFQKCALLVEFELLKDSLDLNERVKLCEKFINIAWHCAKKRCRNYLVCTGLASGLAQYSIPKALWDCVSQPARARFMELEKRFLSPTSRTAGYHQRRQKFAGKFHIPNLFIPLREFELKIDCQPSFHRDFSELVNVKKCLDLYDIIDTFLEAQQHPCRLEPNHDLQMSIAYRMSCCGKVKSTGASTAERLGSHNDKRKKVASQIEIESLANSLNFLGYVFV